MRRIHSRSVSYSVPSGQRPIPIKPHTPTSSPSRDAVRRGSLETAASGLSSVTLRRASLEESPSMRKVNDQHKYPGSSDSPPLVIPKRSARPGVDPSIAHVIPVKPWRRRVSEPLNDTPKVAERKGQLSKSTKTTEEQLEEKISSILTSIPTKIRLTSGPSRSSPEVPRTSFSGMKRPDTLSPFSRGSRQSSEGALLTLAPAFEKSSSNQPTSGDPEIKLYHLHQAGRDAPIKLYVRLVGEHGERVMVRVGGGWADLAEYLKEYANHHGRRSVSDGRFEIKGLPQVHSASPASALSGLHSGRTTPTSRPGSSLGRPASALSVRKVRHPSAPPVGFAGPSTPDPTSSGFRTFTPASTESIGASFRPSSRSSWTTEEAPLGLAGPKSKRVDVSPGKQAWVDDMMEQAKNASAEKKKTIDDSMFEDLGKVGSIKRVFMRSSKKN